MMRRPAVWFFSTMMLLFGLLSAYAADMQSQLPARQPDLVELPKGIVLPVMLLEKVSTETAQLGQPVVGAITQDVFLGTRKVLSRSDRVTGQVVRLEKPIFGRNGILQIEFDRLKTAAGLSVAIESWTETGQEGHYWGGEVTDGTVPEIIPYRVWRIGTYGRVLYQGPRVMGKDVVKYPGDRFVIVIQQPITLVGQ